MDIGMLKNNRIYYEGYEGEPEIILTVVEIPDYNLHVWCGYLEDILQEPPLDGTGWKGFTRDYHLLQGIFSEKSEPVTLDIPEYVHDLENYKEKILRYEETKDVLNLMIEFLQCVSEHKMSVSVAME